jgi:integration host factor subunit alpha
MGTNLTKKNLINSLYMQIGFSKKISGNLLDDILITIIDNLKKNNKIKISKFGTFTVRNKKSRKGRNPITKKSAVISGRNVVLFKPSNEFKFLVNSLNYEKN